MVTARFVVGTSSDAAVLRVHDKVRANMDRIPVGVPEPLIVGRGIDDVAILALTLSPKAGAADRITANDLTRIARELRTEIAKIPDVGLTYLVGETGEMIRIDPDPERLALYGVTLQQLAAKVSGANTAFPAGRVRDAGEADHPGRRRDPSQPRRDRQPPGHQPRRPAGLRPRRGRGRVRHRERRRAGLDRRAVRRRARAGAVGDARHRQARRLERGHRRRGDPAPGRGARGEPHSARHLGRGHPRLRRDRQREGERAPLPPRPRHPVDHRSGRLRHRPPRGVRRRDRDPGDDPADALRLLADGLHPQPRLALRADLLDRHPGRRRHRGDREHRPALGHGRRSRPPAGGDRGGGRGRQPHHRRHAHRGRGTAADAVRLRHDGALHEPDPGERLRRDDLLLLRRGDGHPLADAEDRRPRARRGPRRPRPRRRARAGLCRGRPPAAALQGAELAVPARRRRPHPRLAVALLHQARHREAAALRQQVRAVGGDRPAGGIVGRGHRRGRAGSRSGRAGASRSPLGAGSRRHRRAVQLQWSGAPFLPARHARAGGRGDQPPAQGRARPAEPRDRARHPPAAGGRCRAAGHQPEGGRAAARAAGDGDAARRDLRPRRRDAAAGGGAGRGRVPVGAVRRRRRQFLWAARAAAARDGLDRRRRVLQGRGARRLRHHRHPERRRDGGLFAPRRRPPADPDPHRAPGRRPHVWTSAS